MKTLYLIRHAKSSWKSPDVSDADRPLNKRGERDAPFMGQLLRGMNVRPDLVVASPAVRALRTAAIIAEKIKYPNENITVNAGLYDGGEDETLRLIQTTGDAVQQLMLVGHNPTLTILANELSAADIDNIPTCGIVGVECDVNAWSDVKEASGKMKFFEYPSLYFAKQETE